MHGRPAECSRDCQTESLTRAYSLILSQAHGTWTNNFLWAGARSWGCEIPVRSIRALCRSLGRAFNWKPGSKPMRRTPPRTQQVTKRVDDTLVELGTGERESHLQPIMKKESESRFEHVESRTVVLCNFLSPQNDTFRLREFRDLFTKTSSAGFSPCSIVLLKGMSREKTSPSAHADIFFRIQPTRLKRYTPTREWSCSGPRVAKCVSACEAEQPSPLWSIFCYRDGTIRFLKLTSLTVISNLMSGNAWSYLRPRGLWLSSNFPRGIGLRRNLVPEDKSLTMLLDTSPRNRASQEQDGPPPPLDKEWFPGDGRTLSQRRSAACVSNSWRRNKYLLLPNAR